MSTVDSSGVPKESVCEGRLAKSDTDTSKQRKVQVEKKEHHQPQSDSVEIFPAAARVEDLESQDLETGDPNRQPTGQRSRLQDLPEDLGSLLGSLVFETEEEFEATLQELKLEDEQLVLGEDGQAYYYVPGNEHNAATELIVRKFHEWAFFVKGTAGENTNIRLGPALPGAPPARKRRIPALPCG